MSLVNELVESIMNRGGGILSGHRVTGKDGKLVKHPSVDDVDPISVKDADHKKDKEEFEKSIASRSKSGPATDNFGN